MITKENTMKKVTSKDGTVIAFDRSGKGPAVILVGGAFQYRAIDPPTAQLAALLASHFTVFHYDRRGRGDSSDTLPYTVEREVEDLDASSKKLVVRQQSSGCPQAGSSPLRPRSVALPSRSWRCTSYRSTLVTRVVARRRRTIRDS